MSEKSGLVLTMSWKIINFSLLNLLKGHFIDTRPVCFSSLPKDQVVIKLYPIEYEEEDESFISCCLNWGCRKNCESPFCLMEIADLDGKILKSLEVSAVFEKNLYSFLGKRLMEVRKLKEYLDMCEEDTILVRCHVLDRCFHEKAKLCEIQTEIPTQKSVFRFSIAMIDSQNWTKIIDVPFEISWLEFDITLTPVGDKIFVIVSCSNRVVSTKLCKTKIMILNDRGCYIKLKTSEHVLDLKSKGNLTLFETFFDKALVRKDKSAYSITLISVFYFYEENSLSNFENFSTRNSFKFSSEQPLTANSTTEEKDDLKTFLKTMLIEEKHSDVKLRASKKIFSVHKCLLSVRSPVFSAMFDHDMLESETGLVEIPDVESEILGSFLEYLYTNTIKNTDPERILKLLFVADKYQVDCLKKLCSEILISKLSVENVCLLISEAESVNQPDLKVSSLNFIKSNKKEILPSLYWSELVQKNKDLAFEILSDLAMD